MRLFLMVVVILSSVTFGYALGPHEVLLLVNGKSKASVEIATKYAEMRQIPSVNVVKLYFPKPKKSRSTEISNADFIKYILNPAKQEAEKRGIDDHILAWVYSSGFPTTVLGEPDLSIQGATFLLNKRKVTDDEVDKGTFASRLFAGPKSPTSKNYFSQTFDTYKAWLGAEMPMPSMMLAWTGKNGNSDKEVLAYLSSGLKSDFSDPEGSVYFVVSKDVRSRCRAWQYPKVIEELRTLGVTSEVTEIFPVKKNVMGIMMGTPTVSPNNGNQYMPGCMAEHLTSMAGIFDKDGQTKLTAWLKAGATSSAGTVREPHPLWSKFPNARFYVHYASGCTMIESYFQSIRCPLQILLVGDPLAQPWAVRNEVTLVGLDEGQAVSADLKVKAEVGNIPGEAYSKYMYLLNGKVVGKERLLEYDTKKLRDGSHSLRVVAYRSGLVRSQVFKDYEFVVDNSH